MNGQRTGSGQSGGGGVRRHVLVRRRVTAESNRTTAYKVTARAERAQSVSVGAKMGSSSVVNTHKLS